MLKYNKFLYSTMLSGLIMGAVVGGGLVATTADARTNDTSQNHSTRTVYGIAQSPYVMQVQVILREKNIQYTLNSDTSKASNQSPLVSEFGSNNIIPTYQEGTVTISEPSVIAQYLERTIPTPALYPTDRTDLARALQFESFGNQVLGNVVLRATGAIAGQSGNQNSVEIALREELPRIFDTLEREVGDSTYIAGKSFTIADIAIGAQFATLQRAGESVSAERWPRLASYVDRILRRSSFRTVIDTTRTS